jgi:hypothetical protein
MSLERRLAGHATKQVASGAPETLRHQLHASRPRARAVAPQAAELAAANGAAEGQRGREPQPLKTGGRLLPPMLPRPDLAGKRG